MTKKLRRLKKWQNAKGRQLGKVHRNPTKQNFRKSSLLWRNLSIAECAAYPLHSWGNKTAHQPYDLNIPERNRKILDRYVGGMLAKFLHDHEALVRAA